MWNEFSGYLTSRQRHESLREEKKTKEKLSSKEDIGNIIWNISMTSYHDVVPIHSTCFNFILITCPLLPMPIAQINYKVR